MSRIQVESSPSHSIVYILGYETLAQELTLHKLRTSSFFRRGRKLRKPLPTALCRDGGGPDEDRYSPDLHGHCFHTLGPLFLFDASLAAIS